MVKNSLNRAFGQPFFDERALLTDESPYSFGEMIVVKKEAWACALIKG